MRLVTASDILRGELGDWLEGKRAAREGAARKFWPRIRLTLLAMATIFAAVAILPISEKFAEILLFGALAVGVAWAFSAGNSVAEEVKLGINNSIADWLSITFDPQPQPGAEFQLAYQFGLIPKFSRSLFEDRWSGLYQGQPFSIYEADLFVRSDNGRSWVTVFTGCILSAKTVRDVRSATVIAPHKEGERLFGFATDRHELILGSHLLTRTDIVNPEFQNKFSLWGSDHVEAHYLVDPLRAHQLVQMANRFEADEMRVAFVDGELVIALNWKDTRRTDRFETGSITPEADERQIRETLDQIYSFFDLIEVLK